MYKQQIKSLSKQRDACFLLSDDQSELSAEQEKEIDDLEEQILNLINQDKDSLPIDFIIEELTKLGWAPSLLYDDNGHFAVTADGYQTITEGTSDVTIMCFIPKDYWKDSIREALNYFLDKNS